MNKSSEVKDGIKQVLTGLFESLNKESVEAYRSMSKNAMIESAFNSAKDGNHEDFYFNIIYPFQNILDGMLMEITESHKAKYFIKFGECAEKHYQKLFEKYEGMACCADKSRTVMKAIIRFYMTDEKINFNYNAEHTYHLPEKIFTTHDEIIEFAEGLYSLHYGNPIKYIMAYGKVIEIAK